MKLAIFLLQLLYLGIFAPPCTSACYANKQQSQRSRGSKALALAQSGLSGGGNRLNSVSSHRKFFRIRRLNRADESHAVNNNLRIFEGEELYGSLTVPYPSHGGRQSLKIYAIWGEETYTTPIWLYLRKNDLPTQDAWDKTGVSFTSRGYSRVRLEDASPGQYFIMVEARTDVPDLSIVVDVEEERDVIMLKPERVSIWETRRKQQP